MQYEHLQQKKRAHVRHYDQIGKKILNKASYERSVLYWLNIEFH